VFRIAIGYALSLAEQMDGDATALGALRIMVSIATPLSKA
jgi:hypothetical protein